MNKSKKTLQLPLKPTIHKFSIHHEDFHDLLNEIITTSTMKKKNMQTITFAQYNNDQDACYNAPNGQCYD